MAARKKRVLAPEEQLHAALVPESEWPYEVPENWCWIHWGFAGEFVAGSGFKNAYQGFADYEIPFYKVGSLKYADSDGYLYDTSNTVNEEMRGKLKAALIPPNSILFAKIGEAIRLNRRRLNSVPCCIDNNMMAFIAHACDYKYAFYWSQHIDMYELTNATTVPAIRKTDLEAVPFPLPPLPEQKRIVSRIEWHFAKLDDAEAELREVIDSSEQRQAAILHSAFSGKLSESWRTMHNVNQDTWTVKRFDEVAYIRSNLVDPETFADYPHIAPDNIEKKTGTLLPYRTIGEDGVTSGKHHFYPGQILYSKIRPYLSKAVLVDFEGLCSADMYPIEAIEDTRYLWYYILSEDFLEQTYSAGSRTVLPKINQKGLSAIKVPIPTEAEQRFISKALDTYFESSREAESQVMEALQQIQSLRRTILAKALRGKLGTSDPDEPSSKELLASILSGNVGK